MNFLRNLFSSLISFFLIPLLMVYLILISFFGVLLNPAVVKETLNKNDTYVRLASKIIPQTLIATAAKYSTGLEIPTKVIAAVVDKIDKTMLADDLKKIVESSYDYVTTEKQSFEVRIDLTKYSKAFADNLKPALENYYKSLPVCPAASTQTTASIPTCQIPNTTSKQYLDSLKIDTLLVDIKTGFPEELVVSDKEIATYPQTTLVTANNQNSQASPANSVLKQAQKSVVTYRNYLQALFILIVLLIIILAAARLPKISSSAKWLGSAFFSAGLLPLISSTIILYFLKPEIFTQILSSIIEKATGGKLQTDLVSLLSDNLFTVGQKVFGQMQSLSIVIIVIAIILYGFYLGLEYIARTKAKQPLDAVNHSTHNTSS